MTSPASSLGADDTANDDHAPEEETAEVLEDDNDGSENELLAPAMSPGLSPHYVQNSQRVCTITCFQVRCHCLFHSEWAKRTIRCLFVVLILGYAWRQLRSLPMPTDSLGPFTHYGEKTSPLSSSSFSPRRRSLKSRHGVAERKNEEIAASRASERIAARRLEREISRGVRGAQKPTEAQTVDAHNNDDGGGNAVGLFLSVPEVGTTVRVYNVRQHAGSSGPHLTGTVVSVDPAAGQVEVDLGYGTSLLKTRLDHIQFFPSLGAVVKFRGSNKIDNTAMRRGVVSRVFDTAPDWHCDVDLDNLLNDQPGGVETTQAAPDQLVSLPAVGTIVTRNGSPGVVTRVNEGTFLASVRLDDGTFLSLPPEELELNLVSK